RGYSERSDAPVAPRSTGAEAGGGPGIHPGAASPASPGGAPRTKRVGALRGHGRARPAGAPAGTVPPAAAPGAAPPGSFSGPGRRGPLPGRGRWGGRKARRPGPGAPAVPDDAPATAHRRAGSDDAVLVGEDHRLGAVAQVELHQD